MWESLPADVEQRQCILLSLGGGGVGGCRFSQSAGLPFTGHQIPFNIITTKMYIRLHYSSYRYVWYKLDIHLIIATKLTEN